MFIYQIGFHVIRGVAEHSSPLNWKGDTIQPVQSSRVSFTNRYAVPEVTKIKLSGLLSTSRYPSPIYALNDFISLGGKPYIDIIGYIPDVNTDCEEHELIEPVWFHTYGMITSIDRSYELDPTAGVQFKTIKLDLELQINPYWVPLNRFIWFPYYPSDVPDTFGLSEPVFGTGNPSPNTVETIVNGLALFESPTSVLAWSYESNFVFYKRQNLDSLRLYDPGFWDHWTNATQGIGNDLATDLLQYTVQNPYNGDFKYLHCFGAIDGTGFGGTEISIEVQTEIIPGTLKTFTSSLNIAQVHNTLLLSEFGGTGLTDDMLIYCGNEEPQNSFIIASNDYIRSNITGQIFVPQWDYETRYPGELLGSKCVVTVNDNTETTTEYAYLVLNRAL